jgi:4-hydroxy-3-methylbut-2-enyl diphosphate reductase
LPKKRTKDLNVIVAKSGGFCSGVKRAIKVARQAAADSPTGVYSLGPLIHNPQVVGKLERAGIKPLTRLGKGGGRLVVRSHGASPEVLERAKSRGYQIIDATCPFVRKAQQNARKLFRRGYRVVIVGEKAHPEVKGIRSHVDGQTTVIESIDQAKRLKFGSKVGIIAQTTIPVDTFAAVVAEVARKARELLVFNTICSETARRQEGARRLARRVDAMLVVGGRNSANTSRLKGMCETICSETHHVETADEINGDWFRPGSTVGVVAGASTPGWLVKGIVDRLESM